MNKLLSNFVFLAIFAQISLAKDLGNIFTKVNYIESASPNEVNAGSPFSYYEANLSYYLDVVKSGAAVNDTFNLTLPDVYEARTYRGNPQQWFRISGKQAHDFASCWIHTSIGELPTTNVSCVLVHDISIYEVVSGELVLFLIFNGGATRGELELAQKWKVGSNQVTFNDAIGGELTLISKNITGHSTLLSINSGFRRLFSYLSSESLCPDGILEGKFFITIYDDWAGTADIAPVFDRFESFIASSVNAFGQPTAGVGLADSDIISSSLHYAGSFGPIPQGQHFYFNADVFSIYVKFYVVYDLTVQCASGEEVRDSGKATFGEDVTIYNASGANNVLKATTTSMDSISS